MWEATRAARLLCGHCLGPRKGHGTKAMATFCQVHVYRAAGTLLRVSPKAIMDRLHLFPPSPFRQISGP